VTIQALAEFSLSGNQLAADVHHWQWEAKQQQEIHRETEELSKSNTTITLLPLDIRTFAIVLRPV
jgi:hypothetical protein